MATKHHCPPVRCAPAVRSKHSTNHPDPLDFASISASKLLSYALHVLSVGRNEGSAIINASRHTTLHTTAIVYCTAHCRRSRLPHSQMSRILLGIGRGLHFAHTLQVDGSHRGLVHCDLKPANIFMFQGNVPKIGDWGLARSE